MYCLKSINSYIILNGKSDDIRYCCNSSWHQTAYIERSTPLSSEMYRVEFEIDRIVTAAAVWGWSNGRVADRAHGRSHPRQDGRGGCEPQDPVSACLIARDTLRRHCPTSYYYCQWIQILPVIIVITNANKQKLWHQQKCILVFKQCSNSAVK